MVSQCIQSVISFSLTLLQYLIRNNPDSNVLISPASIYIAVAMVHIGTKNKTREELTNLFGIDYGRLLECRCNQSKLHQELRNVIDILGTGADLNNGIFTALDLDQKYQTILSQIFGIYIQKLSFLDSFNAARVINDYISNGTHGLIRDMIKEAMIHPDLPFMLVSTLYFKGTWIDKFEKSNTRHKPFHPEKGPDINVPFMNQKLDGKLFVDPEKRFEALVMGFNEGEMVGLFVLPKKGTLADLVQSIKADEFLKMIKRAKTESLDISMPKFKLSKESLFKPIFKELGVHELFEPHDFSLNVTLPIAIDDIIQSVMIDLDEEGVVAVAATVVKPCPACLKRYHNFYLDKPFLFLIIDSKTGIPSFVNAIYSPKQ